MSPKIHTQVIVRQNNRFDKEFFFVADKHDNETDSTQPEDDEKNSVAVLLLVGLGISTSAYLYKCSRHLGCDLQATELTLYYQMIPEREPPGILTTKQVRIEERIYLEGGLDVEQKHLLFQLAHESPAYRLLTPKIAMRTELVFCPTKV